MSDRRPRLLVFIVAYYAESTLTSVLERIPAKVRDDFDCEILVVDDASEDRTYAIGREYQQAHPEIRMTVLRNELNQGYGGNQKVGYAFAIERGFDFVAMLHGDGQYAPEELPRLLEPLQRGPRRRGVRQPDDDDVRRAARAGCRSTSTSATGSSPPCRTRCCAPGSSEFHSGYRVYAVPALRRIRFPLNSNDFHFDTEIIIQLLNVGQRIVELPIPTLLRRRDLPRERDAVRQGRAADDAAEVAHGAGRALPAPVRAAATTARQQPLRPQARLPEQPPVRPRRRARGQPRCSTSARGRAAWPQELVAKGCEVAVVDQFPAPDAPGDVEVLQQNLDEPPVFDARKYDHLLMLDVIEHLKDPEVFLEQLVDQFDYEPRTLVLTTPNVGVRRAAADAAVRAVQLRQGGDPGPHAHAAVHLPQPASGCSSTRASACSEVRGVPAPLPKVLGDGALGRLAVRVNELLIRLSRTLFSYQIFVVADCTPNVAFVLEDSRSRSEHPPE